MAVKWATAAYRRVVYPAIYVHQQYWRRKVGLDRMLERRSPLTNVLTGVVLGVAVYFILLPLRSYPVDKTAWQLADDFNSMIQTMHVDPTVELPVVALMRIKQEVGAKVLVANDAAAIRSQRARVQVLKDAGSGQSTA